MRPPLRIAILECDEPIGRTKEKYGGYGGVFKALLQAATQHIAQQDGESPIELDITKWDVVKAELYPNLDNVDAVLLTGSSESHCLYTDPRNTTGLSSVQDITPLTTILGR